MIELTDALDGWDSFDEWLEAERALGAALGRQVMENAKPSDTVDERLAVLDPYNRWAQVLGHNLRRFRSQGYKKASAAELRDHATDQMKKLYQRHGWTLPPTTIPGLRTLDHQ